eukprot:CAMPEP_0194767046 /NCGR_PEP_ID=MMETSP0323_2-20130528/34283_1 /TAXON_ID=2866 ORGANISM="Crypthecodinium cohnii, Strain Seligo" /NCGR_SAMPLE_ID=MMETSP0323_2 /ASSEMBLY_ACC=CAM_ASM_000346 /LENGTH=30 /DNA_ID= /DNA_START= /DNA_END= /DNA_ORIENTATION=
MATTQHCAKPAFMQRLVTRVATLYKNFIGG